MNTKDWLNVRRRVQQRTEALMGERTAAKLLYRGKLCGGLYAGQYVGALLYSVEGCRHVLGLLDALAEGKPVPVTFVANDREPLKTSLLVLKRGRLCRVRASSRREND